MTQTTLHVARETTIACQCRFSSCSGSRRLAAFAYPALYRIRHESGILVFPESEHQPTCSPEFAIVPPIAFDVRRELLKPPTPVGVRCRAMHRTRMPEAAVEEDRDMFLRKDEIRTRLCHACDRAIHFEGKTTSEKQEANPHLNGRVTPTRVVHPA